MSALFALKGDSSIYDVTPHYIHEGDRGDVEVFVRDIFGNPVDGVRVTVFGSWKANNFKDKVWDKTVGRYGQNFQMLSEKNGRKIIQK